MSRVLERLFECDYSAVPNGACRPPCSGKPGTRNLSSLCRSPLQRSRGGRSHPLLLVYSPSLFHASAPFFPLHLCSGKSLNAAMDGAMEPKQLPSSSQVEKISRDGPTLATLLNEMNKGLEVVIGIVQDITKTVKRDDFSTVDGLSFLEAKHLLLISYCQSIVYYLLRKAKGLSVAGHPVIRSLVEIRLFLEKIRPLDKKLEYQVQKLTQAANNPPNNNAAPDENEKAEQEEDPSNLRPNPDMLISKPTQADGVYRPVRLAPTTMDDDKMSKQEKQARRRDKEVLRQSKQSAYLKELMDDVEGRPEEIRESIGAESRELSRYTAQWEERARQEEELFTRAPITKLEKKRQKHLLKSRDGVLGLAESFFDEIRTLPFEDKSGKDDQPDYMSTKRGRKFKKHKRY